MNKISIVQNLDNTIMFISLKSDDNNKCLSHFINLNILELV